MASGSALVLFAHGSRDPEWARPFEALRARLERRLPATPVVLAFLESELIGRSVTVAEILEGKTAVYEADIEEGKLV